MVADLDIDDVVHGNKVAQGQLYEFRKGYDRYEYVRTLDPYQFQELCERNIRGDDRFDDLVDAAIIERRERIG